MANLTPLAKRRLNRVRRPKWPWKKLRSKLEPQRETPLGETTSPTAVHQPAVPNYVATMVPDFEDDDFGAFFNLGLWDQVDVSRTRSQAQDALARFAIAEAALSPTDTVLDLACGFGGLASILAAESLVATSISVDISLRSLAVAASRSPHGLFVCADAAKLPLSSESVDAIICLEAMMHFSSRLHFFGEAKRVLRPGGRLVTTDILLDPSQDGHLAHIEQVTEGFAPWPEPLATSSEIAATARNVGLIRINHQDLTENSRWRYAAPTEGKRPNAASFSQTEAATGFVHLHQSGGLSIELASYVRP